MPMEFRSEYDIRTRKHLIVIALHREDHTAIVDPMTFTAVPNRDNPGEPRDLAPTLSLSPEEAADLHRELGHSLRIRTEGEMKDTSAVTAALIAELRDEVAFLRKMVKHHAGIID